MATQWMCVWWKKIRSGRQKFRPKLGCWIARELGRLAGSRTVYKRTDCFVLGESWVGAHEQVIKVWKLLTATCSASQTVVLSDGGVEWGFESVV